MSKKIPLRLVQPNPDDEKTGCLHCPLGAHASDFDRFKKKYQRDAEKIKQSDRLSHIVRNRNVSEEWTPVDVLFVGEAPGAEEDKEGKPFVGRSGKLLRSVVEKYMPPGVKWGCANAVRCRPSQLNRPPTPTEIRCCSHELKREIEARKPKVIVPLGNKSLRLFLGCERITFLCGKVHTSNTPGYEHLTVVPCVHPAYVLRMAHEVGKFIDAIKVAVSVVTGKHKALPGLGEYRVANTLKKVKQVVREIEAAKLTATDTETSSLNPHLDGSRILCFSFSTKPQTGWVIPYDHADSPWNMTEEKPTFDEIPDIPGQPNPPPDLSTKIRQRKFQEYLNWQEVNDAVRSEQYARKLSKWRKRRDRARKLRPLIDKQLRRIYNKRRGWVLQNRKFDYNYIRRRAGCRMRGLAIDTMTLHTTVDDRRGSHGLDLHASTYTGAGGYDRPLEDYKKEHPEADPAKGGSYANIPGEVLFPYACLHGDSLVALADGTWRSIKTLVRERYCGKVKSLVDGRVVDRPVTGWHRNDVRQKAWYRVVTSRASQGRHGLLGPVFTPDHEVLTRQGRVRVDALVPGKHEIVTDERCFTPHQLSVFLGCLLGDGGVDSRNGRAAGFHFSQRVSTYADWKARVFHNYGPQHTVDRAQPGYVIPYRRYFGHLMEIYPRKKATQHRYRKLVVTDRVLNLLGNLGLAVWYQDDGTYVQSSHGQSSRIYCKINSDEQRRVVSWLSAKFGSGVSYNERSKFIQITGGALPRFHAAVSPYMCAAMQHKTPLPVGCYEVQGEGEAWADRVVEVVAVDYPRHRRRGNGVRYCLTVRGGGNFLTKVGFVSNCADADVTLRTAIAIKKSKEYRRNKRAAVLAEKYFPLLSTTLADMEYAGAKIDVEVIRRLRPDYEKRRDEAVRSMIAIAEVCAFQADMIREKTKKAKNGKRAKFNFNPGSDAQIGRILWDYYKLRPTQLTDTGLKIVTHRAAAMNKKHPEIDIAKCAKTVVRQAIEKREWDLFSTKADVLYEYDSQGNQFAKLVLEFREVDKVISTYLEPLERERDADGCVHGTFIETGTTTGRLCVSADTLIDTDCGTIRISDLPSMLGNGTICTITHTGALAPISDVFVKGWERMYRLEFSDGSYVTATRGHRIRTVSGWRSVDAIIASEVADAGLDRVTQEGTQAVRDGAQDFESCVWAAGAEALAVESEYQHRSGLSVSGCQSFCLDDLDPILERSRISKSIGSNARTAECACDAQEHTWAAGCPGGGVGHCGFTRPVAESSAAGVDRTRFEDVGLVRYGKYTAEWVVAAVGARAVWGSLLLRGGAAFAGAVSGFASADASRCVCGESEEVFPHGVPRLSGPARVAGKIQATAEGVRVSSSWEAKSHGVGFKLLRGNHCVDAVTGGHKTLAGIRDKGNEVAIGLRSSGARCGYRDRRVLSRGAHAGEARQQKGQVGCGSRMEAAAIYGQGRVSQIGVGARADTDADAVLVRVVDCGVCEVWDLTVEHPDHSYAAQGLFHHNSSAHPNLQNQIAEARKAFVSRFKNGYILQADYSQVELRVGCCIFHEPQMIKAYRAGADLHAMTAQAISKLSPEKYAKLDPKRKKEWRVRAKRVNFGILYKIGAVGIQTALKKEGVFITTEEAHEMLEAFRRKYTRMMAAIAAHEDDVRRNGYAVSFTGRVRRVPEVFSGDESLIARALRQVVNFPIQSGAGDLTLMSLVLIHREMKKRKMRSKLILTVHDSIVVDCYDLKEAMEIAQFMKYIMENIHKLAETVCPGCDWSWLEVPLVAEFELGRSWGEGVGFDPNKLNGKSSEPLFTEDDKGGRLFRQPVNAEELRKMVAMYN